MTKSGDIEGYSHSDHQEVTIDARERQQQRVFIILPEQPQSSDGSDKRCSWYAESTDQLKNISRRHALPILCAADMQNSEQRSAAFQACTHCMMAVPYLRANTYAIAIHHDDNLSNKKRTKKNRKLKLDPLYIDLCPPSDTRLGYRIDGGGGGESLLKALSINKLVAEKKKGTGQMGQPLVVYDLTAGLARDSLVILSSFLASNNNGDDGTLIRLHMVERDPIVATLLSDAMRRLYLLAAMEHTTTVENQGDRCTESSAAQKLVRYLSMEEGDGKLVLDRIRSGADTSKTGQIDSIDENQDVPWPPDVIYLDPMFPPRKKKSSAVKKDMAMLHSLLGTAVVEGQKSPSTALAAPSEYARLEEEQALVASAVNSATRRVVVKRPIGAQPLGLSSSIDAASPPATSIPAPSYDIRGSVNRFDVYIVCK